MSMKNIQLGIAPIGWSNDDMPDLGKENTFEQCISEAALSGYEGTEIGGKFPASVNKLKKHLVVRNLKVASKWFGSYLCTQKYGEVEKEFEKELKILKELGSKRINVCEMSYCLFDTEKSMFSEKAYLTDDEWNKLTDGLNKLGALANQYDISLCYHHHMATVIESIDQTKRLLDSTDSDKVSLCYDTGHFAFAGEDPLKAAELFKDRTKHIHLKDIRKNKMDQAMKDNFWFRKAVLENCFTIPGDGFINFKDILQEFSDNNYEGWVVVEAEQDPQTHNPFKVAKRSYKYVTNIINETELFISPL